MREAGWHPEHLSVRSTQGRSDPLSKARGATSQIDSDVPDFPDHRSDEFSLRLVDPRRVLERGYALLRVEGGEVLTRAGQAPEGTMVRARLKSGSLRLRSEGEGKTQGEIDKEISRL